MGVLREVGQVLPWNVSSLRGWGGDLLHFPDTSRSDAENSRKATCPVLVLPDGSSQEATAELSGSRGINPNKGESRLLFINIELLFSWNFSMKLESRVHIIPQYNFSKTC